MTMADVKEFGKDVKVSVGAIVFGIFFVISLTFSATTIYWRFGVVEAQMNELQVVIEKELNIQSDRIEYVNDRIDRKSGQLEDKIDANKDEHKEFVKVKN